MALEELIHRIATDESFANQFDLHPEQTLSALGFELKPAEREGFLRMLQARNKAQEEGHTEGTEWYRSPVPDTTSGISGRPHTEGTEWYRSPVPGSTSGIESRPHTEGTEWYRSPSPDSRPTA